MASGRIGSVSPTPGGLSSIGEEDTDLQITAAPDSTKHVARPLPCAQRQPSIRECHDESQRHGVSLSSTDSVPSKSSSRPSLARSLRSPSASSLWYHIKKVPMHDAIPLGASADPARVKEFLELAQKRAEAFKSNIHHSRAFQVFWFFALSCVIYFGFIGFPLWDGVAYSI